MCWQNPRNESTRLSKSTTYNTAPIWVVVVVVIVAWMSPYEWNHLYLRHWVTPLKIGYSSSINSIFSNISTTFSTIRTRSPTVTTIITENKKVWVLIGKFQCFYVWHCYLQGWPTRITFWVLTINSTCLLACFHTPEALFDIMMTRRATWQCSISLFHSLFLSLALYAASTHTHAHTYRIYAREW